MDLSDPQRTVISIESLSNSQIKDQSLLMMNSSKKDIFLSTYRRQRFTFPNSIMHYIAKNPKNSEVYEKMVKKCKYFFIKNSILVIDKLYYNHNGWKTLIKDDMKSVDINKLLCKLWITDELHVYPEILSKNSIVSSIIPKIYQCDAKHLSLHDQNISLNEFMFLCSSVKNLRLNEVTIKNEDGTEVSFDKLIKQLPQIKEIFYVFFITSNNISKAAFKELWKISHLSNYDSFNLFNIPEDFDIDGLYSFMKKNKKTDVYLKFFAEISEEYKIRLEAIIDEIIATKNHEYKIPYIYFPRIDEEKYNKLRRIYFQ